MRLLYVSARDGSEWLFIHDLQPLEKGANCINMCKNELDISLKHWYYRKIMVVIIVAQNRTLSSYRQ